MYVTNSLCKFMWLFTDAHTLAFTHLYTWKAFPLLYCYIIFHCYIQTKELCKVHVYICSYTYCTYTFEEIICLGFFTTWNFF